MCQKKIIKTALSHITQEEYQEKLTETIKKKIKTDGEPKNIAQKSKLIRFLQSKGFESDLIFNETTDILKNTNKKKNKLFISYHLTTFDH